MIDAVDGITAFTVRVPSFVGVGPEITALGFDPTDKVIVRQFRLLLLGHAASVGPCRTEKILFVVNPDVGSTESFVGSCVMTNFTKDTWLVPGVIITSKLAVSPTFMVLIGGVKERVVAGAAELVVF